MFQGEGLILTAVSEFRHKDLLVRLIAEGSQLMTNCHRLKMTAPATPSGSAGKCGCRYMNNSRGMKGCEGDG